MRSLPFAFAAVLGAAVIVLGGAVVALAQVQDKDQQKCVNALNKDGAAVAKAQGKEHLTCQKNKGKEKLVGSAQDCLTADAKDKVQKKKDKTVQDEGKKCQIAPDFGYTSATMVNDGAQQAQLDLVEDVYGSDLDAATILCSASKDGCKCQQQVSKAVEKQAQTKLKLFLKCKKNALKKTGASSTADLEDCVDDPGTEGSLAADTKDKITKGIEKIEKAIVKKCDEKGVTTGAFPGDCDGLTGAALATCLDVLVECRVCQMLNEMDGLFVNCDLFDDGVVNASCDSGTGPTPTPTLTATPTPSPTATPDGIFAGALFSNNGHWTEYGPTAGQVGGEERCASEFPGSHLCTLAELQAAEGAGELVGITDINSVAVTGFWVVDSGLPGDEQCAAGGGGSGARWLYQTAHINNLGRAIPLENGTGTLGTEQTGLICGSNTRQTGCCFP